MRRMAQVLILLLFIACFGDFVQATNVNEMEMGHGDSPPERPLTFSWNNCSSLPNPLLEVKLLSISPDPIPSDTSPVTVSVTVDVKKDLPPNGVLSANAKIQLISKGMTVDLCHYVPFCDIPDVCKMMKKYMPKCPKVLSDAGFSCSCPIKAKTYKVTKYQFELPRIPKGIQGNLTVAVDVMLDKNKVGCFEVNVCLVDCKSEAHQ